MLNHYTLDEKIEITSKITRLTTFLLSAAITFAIGILLIKLLWAWIIPDLFPLAVEQGLIAGSITWLTAFKITVLSAILTSTGSLIAGQWGR